MRVSLLVMPECLLALHKCHTPGVYITTVHNVPVRGPGCNPLSIYPWRHLATWHIVCRKGRPFRGPVVVSCPHKQKAAHATILRWTRYRCTPAYGRTLFMRTSTMRPALLCTAAAGYGITKLLYHAEFAGMPPQPIVQEQHMTVPKTVTAALVNRPQPPTNAGVTA